MFPRLLKYLRAEHAVAMVKRGRILLRPPQYFRALEQLDPARGDRNESLKQVAVVVHDPREIETLESGERRMLQRVLGRVLPPMKDVAVIDIEAANRALLFCMTRDASGVLHREFETDTIVEIPDVWTFAKYVRAAALRTYGVDHMLATVTPCHYKDSSSPMTRPGSTAAYLEPYAIKGRKFAHQAEYRIVLESRQVDFSKWDAHFLDGPELASICRLRAVQGIDPMARIRRVLNRRFSPNDPCPCGQDKKLKRCCG